MSKCNWCKQRPGLDFYQVRVLVDNTSWEWHKYCSQACQQEAYDARYW